jgi:hypothetical protein
MARVGVVGLGSTAIHAKRVGGRWTPARAGEPVVQPLYDLACHAELRTDCVTLIFCDDPEPPRTSNRISKLLRLGQMAESWHNIRVAKL